MSETVSTSNEGVGVCRIVSPLESYVRAVLDGRDADRRKDQYRADAMGEVRTINESGLKAVVLDHEANIIRGSSVLDVHGTLKAIAKARNIPDLRDQSAVENYLTLLCRQNHTELVYTKRADQLRVT